MAFAERGNPLSLRGSRILVLKDVDWIIPTPLELRVVIAGACHVNSDGGGTISPPGSADVSHAASAASADSVLSRSAA